MKNAGQTMGVATSGYVMGLLGIAGVASVIAALVIAWPALGYLLSRIF